MVGLLYHIDYCRAIARVEVCRSAVSVQRTAVQPYGAVSYLVTASTAVLLLQLYCTLHLHLSQCLHTRAPCQVRQHTFIGPRPVAREFVRFVCFACGSFGLLGSLSETLLGSQTRALLRDRAHGRPTADRFPSRLFHQSPRTLSHFSATMRLQTMYLTIPPNHGQAVACSPSAHRSSGVTLCLRCSHFRTSN